MQSSLVNDSWRSMLLVCSRAFSDYNTESSQGARAAGDYPSSAKLPDRLLIHMIHDDHRYGSLLLYQLQSKLFFYCLENRDAVGIGRIADCSRRSVRIRSLRRLQRGPGRPAHEEIPATFKTGRIDDGVIDVSTGHLLQIIRQL